MPDRNKWAFWSFVLAASAVICVPSSLFLSALKRYQDFWGGFDPSALRPAPARFLPHRHGRPGPGSGPALEFVEFRLRAPQAREVHLVGEFNGWREGSLSLARQPDGLWEILLPLPPGRYHYLFVVDGQLRLDPSNPEGGIADGRRASLKVVP